MGCGDPETPKGGWIDRDGNKAIFGCNGKETTWTLTCDGTQWTGSKKSCDGGNFFECFCTEDKLSLFPRDDNVMVCSFFAGADEDSDKGAFYDILNLPLGKTLFLFAAFFSSTSIQ